MTKKSVLKVEHLSKTYGKRVVLRDISMIASTGESVGLLGPNGAGKSIPKILHTCPFLNVHVCTSDICPKKTVFFVDYLSKITLWQFWKLLNRIAKNVKKN